MQLRVCAKRTARLSCLLLCVLWLQPAVEIILFIHPSCCAIDCFICLYCLFVSVLFPHYEENIVYYTCKVVARASAWPLVGVYFYDRLRFFNTRGLYLLHIYLPFIVWPECLPFQTTFSFFLILHVQVQHYMCVCCVCACLHGDKADFLFVIVCVSDYI